MNTKKWIDLRISLSGKMSRSAFWLQLLILAGLTLLVLFGWALLSIDKFLDIVFTLGVDLDYISPRDIFDSWQTWLLGIYGVWLLVTTFCMLVRRLRDTGMGCSAWGMWWVPVVVFIGIKVFSGSTMAAIIVCLLIISFTLLLDTLWVSMVVEGEEAAPAAPAGAWLLALVPWVPGVLLYVTYASSWVELSKGFDAADQDEVVALAHFNRAAERGNKVAKLMLLEKAVQRKDPAALPTVCQLAESGYAIAQCYLFVMYAEGYPGVKPDMEEALKWLKKAADQGNKMAIEKWKALVPESAPPPKPAGTPAICTVCGGKGVNAAGYTCPVCGGAGVAK